MLNDVQFLNDVKLLADVHKLNDVLPLNNVQGLRDVAPISLVNSYTTPRVIDMRPEKANSLLDVVLGRDQRNELLEDYGDLYYLKDIPGLNILAGALAHEYDAFLKPIVDNGITSTQGYKEIGLNTMIELSEDLDIFSNIVKSQMPLAGGEFGSLETLSDSLGGNGERTVYNYNTGNFFTDVALETLSDPLTFIELGLGSIKNAGKEGAEAVAEQAIKESSEEISEQTARYIAKDVVLQYGENI